MSDFLRNVTLRGAGRFSGNRVAPRPVPAILLGAHEHSPASPRKGSRPTPPQPGTQTATDVRAEAPAVEAAERPVTDPSSRDVEPEPDRIETPHPQADSKRKASDPAATKTPRTGGRSRDKTSARDTSPRATRPHDRPEPSDETPPPDPDESVGEAAPIGASVAEPEPRRPKARPTAGPVQRPETSDGAAEPTVPEAGPGQTKTQTARGLPRKQEPAAATDEGSAPPTAEPVVEPTSVSTLHEQGRTEEPGTASLAAAGIEASGSEGVPPLQGMEPTQPVLDEVNVPVVHPEESGGGDQGTSIPVSATAETASRKDGPELPQDVEASNPAPLESPGDRLEPPSLDEAEAEEPRPVEIRIGTVEISAAPSASAAEPPAVPSLKGFDDHIWVRNYIDIGRI